MGAGTQRCGVRQDKLEAGKFPVDVALVERLIAAQFPQWADLPIRHVEQDGWDNWTFHLGDRMKVRLPTAEGYAEQAEKEVRWLPLLAPHLPLQIPVPIGVGQKSDDFPWSWSIYEWIEGTPATRALAGDVDFARDVANFLNGLQRVDAAGGPPPGQHSYLRGADFAAAYGSEARDMVAELGGRIDTAGAIDVLAAAEVVRADAPVWVHGDIAVGNLLLRDGRLAAVIDFGCCAVGDPACDLVMGWVFFTGAAREAFRHSVDADAGTWARARGWALWKAALLGAGGNATHPAEAPPLEVIAAVIAEHRHVA